MNESSRTIRRDKNPDGSTDISVNGDIDEQTHFREVFFSLDMLRYNRKRNEWRECWKFGYNRTPYSAYSDYPKIDKTSGQIISEQKRNIKFPFTDMPPIRRFAEIAGIKFDERKFRNRREFQSYFQSLLKENVLL